MTVRAAQSFVSGTAEGTALVLTEPLSFWGGVDVASGAIIDHSHPQFGQSVRGRILVMPGGRGSSSSSSVLAETLRRGSGPVGIVMARPDPIITVGGIVARSLYGVACPVVVCSLDGIATGMTVRLIAEDGEATVEAPFLASLEG